MRCYERAESNNDREGIALQELARLHHESGNDAQAASYYARNLARRDAQQLDSGPDTIEALKFLAMVCKRNGELERAQKLCTRLLDCGGSQVRAAPHHTCAPAVRASARKRTWLRSARRPPCWRTTRCAGRGRGQGYAP